MREPVYTLCIIHPSLGCKLKFWYHTWNKYIFLNSRIYPRIMNISLDYVSYNTHLDVILCCKNFNIILDINNFFNTDVPLDCCEKVKTVAKNRYRQSLQLYLHEKKPSIFKIKYESLMNSPGWNFVEIMILKFYYTKHNGIKFFKSKFQIIILPFWYFA